MQLSVILSIATLVMGVLAAPTPAGSSPPLNLNQGSDRPVIKGDDGTFQVEQLRFDDESVADQVACAFDEKDCLAAGGSSASCKQQKVDCQSGNALNGQSAKLNNESP